MGSCNHVGISRNNFFLRTVCSVPLLLNLEFPIHGMTIIDLSSCSAWILNLIRKQREMIEILNSFHHSSYSHNLQTLSSSQCIFCTFLPPIFCIHWDLDMFQFILLGCLQVNHLALIIIIIIIAILNNVIFQVHRPGVRAAPVPRTGAGELFQGGLNHHLKPSSPYDQYCHFDNQNHYHDIFLPSLSL